MLFSAIFHISMFIQLQMVLFQDILYIKFGEEL